MKSIQQVGTPGWGLKVKGLPQYKIWKRFRLGLCTTKSLSWEPNCLSLNKRIWLPYSGRTSTYISWAPLDAFGIDTRVVCHLLSIDPPFLISPMSQRKLKVGEDKRTTIDKEFQKLKSVGFITEVKYPSLLSNMVLVKKDSNTWRMCVDFTDINDSCLRDPHYLTNIDCLIGESSGYKTLTFMDVDSRYNQIKMNPINAPNMTCMSNHANYYYNSIPF